MSSRASVRVFQSDFLERFTHVHPITPLLIWVPVLTFFLYRAFEIDNLSLGPVLGMGISAIAIWTFMEYVLHRWIFHFEGRTHISRRLQFMIHGLHHDDPSDPTRLVMPPIASIILGVVFYMGFRAVLGPVWVDPFFAFFVVGYLCYDYVHYSVHHFRPRTKLGKYLKQNHMNHHFRSPESLWGVSSPIWDFVFGTVEDQRTSIRTGTPPSGETSVGGCASASPARHGS